MEKSEDEIEGKGNMEKGPKKKTPLHTLTGATFVAVREALGGLLSP